ncbi:MAG: phenylalanine--tRNA ligase subunit alpha [Anaeroplasmataceae bacterium]
MKNKLEQLVIEAQSKIDTITTKQELMTYKSEVLGKKGPIASIMSNMKDLTIDEKKEIGALSNKAKDSLERLIYNKLDKIEEDEINLKLSNETIDVTLPGFKFNTGTIHPLNQTIMELEDLFIGMGYSVCDGPEIETDENCFEKLNLPKGHPARDMQDTFYIDIENLLRSQTSPVQVRTMLEKKNTPIKIICPGKVYRRDEDDATHSHQFMQCEGLVLGKDISFANLKAALLELVKKMFGESRTIRLRPSFFPFTEPSVEVDVSCYKCNGEGCSLCKHTGWIEILGAGMVNNAVLEMCGYDSNEFQGFAFGIGIERVCMLKNEIDDIRNFYVNDLRFLNSFKVVK